MTINGEIVTRESRGKKGHRAEREDRELKLKEGLQEAQGKGSKIKNDSNKKYKKGRPVSAR